MKRKRFIKIMMAKGLSRNKAVLWANDIVRQKGAYARVDFYIKLVEQEMIERLEKAFSKMASSAKEAEQQMRCLCAVLEAEILD